MPRKRAKLRVLHASGVQEDEGDGAEEVLRGMEPIINPLAKRKMKGVWRHPGVDPWVDPVKMVPWG